MASPSPASTALIVWRFITAATEFDFAPVEASEEVRTVLVTQEFRNSAAKVTANALLMFVLFQTTTGRPSPSL